MPRNQARAPLLAKGFPTIPSMRPRMYGLGDLTITNKQNKTKQNKQPILIVRSSITTTSKTYSIYTIMLDMISTFYW